MNLLPRSLRWRIQLWHGLLLLAVLAGFGVTAFQLEKTNEFRRIDARLAATLSSLHAGFADGTPPPRGPPPGDDALDFLFGSPLDGAREPEPGRKGPRRSGPKGALPSEVRDSFARGDGSYFVVWTRAGDMLDRSPNAPGTSSQPDRSEAPDLTTAWRSVGDRREAFMFTPPGECLLVGRSISAELRHLSTLAAWLAGSGGVVLLAGLAGGAWLASRATRPVEAISATAARIAEGHLAERIRVEETESEIGSLAAVLNDTFAKLDDSFARQAQFTADAAHEIRTPLAVILSQSQLALSRARTAEEYKTALEICARSARRMQGLSESLLELSRLDSMAALEKSPEDLAAIARESLELIRPLAEEKGIILRADLAPAICPVHREQMGQVMMNLLSNAVKFCERGTEVGIATAMEEGGAILRVRDTGPGIAAEHLPRLFDRFYRADASRSRSSGGAGLGLAICKAIVKAHGGEITVESAPGAGAAFTVRLPAGGS